MSRVRSSAVGVHSTVRNATWQSELVKRAQSSTSLSLRKAQSKELAGTIGQVVKKKLGRVSPKQTFKRLNGYGVLVNIDIRNLCVSHIQYTHTVYIEGKKKTISELFSSSSVLCQ